ncbi:MAG TPA: hypothetical protein VN688_23605 [Gemmataceae bacterium]|nr:hypothetical protein [Gemmataceae bacterium]
MSLFGKILAIFNIFAVFGAVALIGMDYAKRRSWEYAVFRQELMINGLPLDDEERNEQGRLLIENIGPQTQKDLFGGNAPVTTQTAEVQRVQSNLKGKIQGAGDKKKQIYLTARVLMPLAVSNEQRARMIAYTTYLRDDKSFDRLKKMFTAADRVASQPPKDAKRVKSYEEAFNDTLATQYTEPAGPLAEAYLVAKKADPNAMVDKALDQSLDAQLTQLQGQFEQAFREALERKPPKEGIKSDPPSMRKRAIAHLLFNLIDVLPNEAPGDAAPKLEQNPEYKRYLLVVGVRAAADAITGEANLLKDIADEVALERLRERSVFALEHHKAVEMVQDKAVEVEMHGLVYALKQKELADHEEDLKKRRLDVKSYTEELTDLRQQTATHLKELRTMSDALYKLRVKLRDDTAENQRLEKQIRVLEEGR